MSAGNAPSLDGILSAHRVFGRLSPGPLRRLASQAERTRYAAGTVACEPGHWGERLMLLEQGAVELADADLGWSQPLAAGDWFGAGVSALRHQDNCRVTAVQDTLVLALPQAALLAACQEQPGFALFFPTLPLPAQAASGPHGDAAAGALGLLAAPVGSLLQRGAATASPAASIAEVARRMRAERVSSMLLLEDGALVGLVTDRDLRSRVLAADVDPRLPVAQVATPAPVTIQAGSPAFEAMALMARHSVHHLPVLEGARVVGVLTAGNLPEQQGTSPVRLAGDIRRQPDVAGLAHAASGVGALQRNLALAGASADGAGRIVTAITDAVTIRLIQLAEAKLGPAPVHYAWVAAGSQGRREQTARTDQDNCLVLDDGYEEARHGAYFRDFARFVCDGLDACGYVHCPGGMMAMADCWRQPRQRWVRYFRQWIEQPDPQALMLTSVFFDLRAIHGDTALLEGLRADVLHRTRGNSLFLAHMVGNALQHRPPLGLFGNIAPARGGDHAGQVDLKHNGIVPIVDLARVYALAGGLDAVNTQDRLRQAAGCGEVSVQGARDLGDALEVLGKVRLKHQARRMAMGQPADNFLALEELSGLDRNHLRDAFGVVHGLQSVLAQRYGRH